ncbi:MAG: hypothetical protein P8M30_21090 [Planctomycetaceae bacterium]|jgi:septal ring factor EnvC (AmiA/AmiB activator)|nr:hypothetical protein [Planctomycetaceae bacterium]
MRRTLVRSIVCLSLLSIPLLWWGTSAIAEREPNPDELHAHRENLEREHKKLGQREHELEEHLHNLGREMEAAERELDKIGEVRERLEHEVEEISEVLEEHEQDEEEGDEPRGELGELFELVGDLRNEVRALRREVNELKEDRGPRRPPEVRLSREEIQRRNALNKPVEKEVIIRKRDTEGKEKNE